MEITYINKKIKVALNEQETEKQIIQKIQDKLAEMTERDMDYQLNMVKKLKHEADSHLRCVLVKKEHRDVTWLYGYVTWLYNIESDSFSEGKYFDSFSYDNKETCKLHAERFFYQRYE